VALFFVISGYLITTLLRREHDATGTVNLPRFFFRRSLRLFPLYYVTLAVYVVLVLGLHQFSPDNRALFVQKLPAYVFYYANLVPHATQGPFFFAWSLSTEEQFYAVFGALFRWLSSRWILAVAGLALAAKLISYATVGPEAMAQGPLSIVFSYREPIVLGVLLAYGLATERGRSIAAWLGKPGPMLTLGGAIVTMLLATPLGDHNLPLGELLYVLMTALVAGAVTGKPFAVLEAAPMTHVGRVSYGIYLLHMLTLDPLKRLLPTSPWLVLALGAVMSVVAATIANRVIERPVARWRARREARA
jgi:peptidoglycan/LPS O-acetylase OafA/YrhL